MKLQRSTGILLGIAISLVTTVAIFETQKDAPSGKGATLYDFAEADVSEFTLKRDDETLTFTKTDDTWEMIEPEESTADPSSVAFLLNILTSDTIQETITTTTNQLKTYGLDQPTSTIKLTVDDANYQLSVGDEDFSGTSLYVMTNHNAAETDSVDIYLMPKQLENGIERPVSDWITNDEENQTNSTDDNTDNSQNKAINDNTEPNSVNKPESDIPKEDSKP